MKGEPKTTAEKLDAAKDGEAFKAVLLDLFSALDEAREHDDDD